MSSFSSSKVVSLTHWGGNLGKTGEGSCHRRLEATAESVAGMEGICEWEEGEEGEGPSGQGAAEGKDVSEGCFSLV